MREEIQIFRYSNIQIFRYSDIYIFRYSDIAVGQNQEELSAFGLALQQPLMPALPMLLGFWECFCSLVFGNAPVPLDFRNAPVPLFLGMLLFSGLGNSPISCFWECCYSLGFRNAPVPWFLGMLLFPGFWECCYSLVFGMLLFPVFGNALIPLALGMLLFPVFGNKSLLPELSRGWWHSGAGRCALEAAAEVPALQSH